MATITECRIAVQCTAPCGQTGTFLRLFPSNEPVSPIFGSLAGLFPWLYENGWQVDEHTPQGYIPWRVSRVEKTPVEYNLEIPPDTVHLRSN